jgi:methenyltetrahydromethanopterin cyclohydrolase
MKESINQNALAIFKEMLSLIDELNCAVIDQPNGATIIDAGINIAGSAEAGHLVGEICMGGLGAIRLAHTHIDTMTLPVVIVSTNRPSLATLGSQHAGWRIEVGDYIATASGPARALACVEKELYAELGYSDNSKEAVIVLESHALPSSDVTAFLAEKCGVLPSNLYCIVAPTASKVGSVQVSARILEVGLHKLHALGLKLDKIRRGYGVAPVAPVAKNDAKAMGVCNDCILYGGRVFLFIRSDASDNIPVLIERAHASASPQYGVPFYNLFKDSGPNFHKVYPLLFGPAELTINDIESGMVYKAGAINPEILKESLATIGS